MFHETCANHEIQDSTPELRGLRCLKRNPFYTNLNVFYSIQVLKPDPVTAVACGRHHTLVALESGTVMAMGSNSEGQLGCGRNPDYTTEPIQVSGSLLQSQSHKTVG